MAATEAGSLCAMCKNLGTQSCTDCREIRYCSQACQKSDWPVHELLCKALKDFGHEKRPGPNFKRAIYFPVAGPKPHFIWLRISDDAVVDLSTVPEDTTDMTLAFAVTNNRVLHRVLDTTLAFVAKMIQLRPKSATASPEPNRSLTTVDEEFLRFWGGPALVFGFKDEDGQKRRGCDLGPMDFRHAVDHFRALYYKGQSRRIEHIEGDKVKGVRLNCLGDTDICQRPQFEGLDVSAAACTWPTEVKSSLTENIDIPLVIKKLPPALVWRDRRLQHSTSHNHKIGHLNPDSKDYAVTIPDAPSQDQADAWMFVYEYHTEITDIGSVIVVRKDGKPLYPSHLAAIADYFAAIGHCSMTVCTNHEQLTTAAKEEFLTSGSEEEFKEYYVAWTQLNLESEGDSGGIRSPYDV
ncbi:hypothetical protein BDV95DRAFT_501280 [Massariosphaeria phaeospora]|uniref:MYND-type domain-containing protein n=1 Tax=Massariosphaeria phaeospora TaxID=100035 RepID=A0A7C8I174_9PLEO|nr:hypothetical protein BDV95DRAFT_501280 [Massariosphaeria phaeospora]